MDKSTASDQADAFVSEFSSLGIAAASGANNVGTGKLHGLNIGCKLCDDWMARASD